jgi:hypothetical protein
LHRKHLLQEIRPACRNVFGARCAIAWQSGLQNAGDIDIGARQTHGANHLVEFLARWTNEWTTDPLLGFAGNFANEHDFCIGCALAKDELPSPARSSAQLTRCGVARCNLCKPRMTVLTRSGRRMA